MTDQQQPQQQEMNTAHVGGLDLPIGFHFHPSDYEIINHYLKNKVWNREYTCIAMGEVDLNKTEPWDLPRMAKMGEKEWYFFYQKDRKYPMGLRANRATEAGYWKVTGKDKEIYDTTKAVNLLVGMKKTLVFYMGRALRGNKTNWVMHEYRLEGSDRLPSFALASSSATNATTMKASVSKDEWVVCRVYEKTSEIKKKTETAYQVAMVDAEIEQNHNNIPAIPNPMPLQLPLHVHVPMQFPILTDFAMDPVPPYYPNASAGFPPMIPAMAGISDAFGLEINNAMFGNLIDEPPQMNFYHQIRMGVAPDQMGMVAPTGQMDMGAAIAQMDMGVAGASDFDAVALESRPPSSMVSQKDEHINAAEISSTMYVTSPRSVTTTIEMDGIWNYKY